MNAAGLKLLCGNMQDFKAAALHVEREIRVQGLTHDPQAPLINKMSWNCDPWISKKTVSLFNLGIALELMLKLLLIMYERETPNEHSLTKIYDGLPRDVREELERRYRKELTRNLDGSCKKSCVLSRLSSFKPSSQIGLRTGSPNYSGTNRRVDSISQSNLLGSWSGTWNSSLLCVIGATKYSGSSSMNSRRMCVPSSLNS